jgi:hypothetical protein
VSLSLVDAARALGLEALARGAESFAALPSPASNDAGLDAPIANEELTALAQAVRRGLDPLLVSVLRAAWQGRTVERGLLAWDVLTGSVLAPDDPALESLRADARRVSSVLPSPGQRWPRPGRAGQLIEELAVPDLRHLTVEQLGSGRSAPLLGWYKIGYERLGDDPAGLERLRQFAALLHRAHLPVLAAFHLDDLWHTWRYRPALDDLIEVLLDAGAPDVETLIDTAVDAGAHGGIDMVEWLAYARARTQLNANKTKALLEWAELRRQVGELVQLEPAIAARVRPLPTLAYADAALRNRQRTVPFEVVSAINAARPGWRYGFRVAAAYTAAASNPRSADFLQLIDKFLGSFGDDYRFWYDVVAAAPDGAAWLPGALAMLVREARSLPHNPAAWQAVARIFVEDALSKAAFDEVDERLRAQSTL